jgi:hexosaminidase
MIDQVMAVHTDIKYLHIGCDEVYYLGECVRCGLTMVDHQWSKKQLFLHHVSRLAK